MEDHPALLPSFWTKRHDGFDGLNLSSNGEKLPPCKKTRLSRKSRPSRFPSSSIHLNGSAMPDELTFRAQLDDAQKQKVFKIDGRDYPRIACGYEEGEYGNFVLDTSFDEHESNDAVCVDCGAPSGFLHILGCECEQCPRCGEQALGCPCKYAGSEAWKHTISPQQPRPNRSSRQNLHGLLFRSDNHAFLDYKLFEDLALPDFEECPEGWDVAARLIAREPALAKLPKATTLFEWLLRRLNHLSSGRLILDSDEGDEGYYPLTILVTKGPNPIAMLDFEGNDYGVNCFARGETAAACEEAVSIFVDVCASDPKKTRNVDLLER